MRNTRSFGIGILFALIISVGFIVHLLFPDVSFSVTENRTLSKMPEVDMDNYMSEKYQDDVESYLLDQFPNRSFFTRFKSDMNMLLGMKEIDDVVVGNEWELFLKTDYDMEDANENISLINTFVSENEDLNYHFMLAPNKSLMYEEWVPSGALKENKESLYYEFYNTLDKNIETVDLVSLFKNHKEEYLYYHSDHHWTTLAAYYAASEFIKEDLGKYEVLNAEDSFYGTLANRINCFKRSDIISLYEPVNQEVNYIVEYSGKKKASIYDLEKLLTSDAYAVFFGGNHDVVKISTDVMNDKRLLVFKDSYANCLIPFLIPYYNEIVLVDTRYYFDDIHKLIEEEHISDVLFLYNMDTFFEDISMSILKEAHDE